MSPTIEQSQASEERLHQIDQCLKLRHEARIHMELASAFLEALGSQPADAIAPLAQELDVLWTSVLRDLTDESEASNGLRER